MADSTRIEELLSAKSIKDFDELKLRVDASVASVEQLTLKAVQLNTALGSVKSPKDFNSTIKEIEQAEKSLLESTRKLAVEQGKLNNATNLQNQKKEINDLIIKNKELTNQLKEQQLAKQQQAASEKAASAQRKADLQNEKIANEEKILLLRQEQAEMDALLKKTEALDRAEEDRLTNNAVASQPQAGQDPRAAQPSTPFVASTELQKSAALVKSYETSLANVRLEQGRVNAALKAGAITQAEADAQLNKLIIDENRYKIALSEAQKTLTLQNKANEFAKGSLDQRRIALDRLNKSYALLNATERASAGGQRQLKIIQDLTAQVSTLEQTVGKSQRAVGGYGNAITNAFGKAFGVVRQLAYVLPGIGIAGILGLISEAVIDFVSSFIKANDKINVFKDNLANLNEVVSNSNKDAAKQTTDLKILYAAATNVNDSMEARLRAVDALQKEFPDFLGNISKEAILNGDAKKSYDLLNEAIVANARAKAAKTKIDELESRKLDSDFQKQKIRNATAQESLRAQAGAAIQGATATDEFGNALETALVTKADKLTEIAKRKAKALSDEDLKQTALDAEIKFLIEFAGAKNITKAVEDEQLKQVSSRQKTNDKLKAVKKEFDDENAQLDADSLKQVAKNEDYYLAIRLKNRNTAFQLEENLRKRTLAFNLSAAKDEFDASINNESGKKGGGDPNAVANATNKLRSDSEKLEAESNKKKIALELQFESDISFIRNSFNAKRREQDAKDNAEALAQFTKAAEDKKKAELEAISSRAEREVNGIDADRDNQLRIINDTANARIEAAKGNSDKITKIEKQAALDSLQVTIDAERLKISVALNAQQQLLAIAKKNGNQDDISKLTAKIKELEKQLSELTNKELKLKVDVDSTGLDKVISTLEKISDIYGKLSSIVSDAFQANATAEKNQIQDQIDLLDQKTKTEIDGVNATTASEQDKAAKIAIINARTDAQKRQYELRQRQVDERKAQFDKAAAIGQIIIQTALAVTKALPVIPLAVLAGALGAAQLAVAIATPIPHYETGTTDAKGGWSLVGEKRKELVVTPEGRMIETPGTPTIMNIPKHSIVFPDSRKLMEGGIGRREIAAMKRQDRGELFYMLGGKMDKIGRIIKDKTETHFHQKGGNWEKIKKSGGNTTRYIS